MNRLNKLALLRRFAPQLYASRRIVELDDIELRAKMAHAIRHIAPDERARLGVVFDGEHFRDLDSRGVYTMVKNELFDPINERLDRMERMLIAAGPGGATKATEMLAAPNDTTMPRLPSRVPLSGLLDGPPSFRDVILGVALDENGQPQVVRSDMAKLVHVAVGGSSGWGKSVFLRSLGYQLAKSADPVDLVMVDLEGTTLAPFAECDRLLYSVVDNETDATNVLRDLEGELSKRSELFAQFPGVDSLYAYNARSEYPLRPVVALIDEATALLENTAIASVIRTLALRARKYGLWLVLAGQDWKASSLDTAIRNQLSTRVQFRAMSGSQSRVLLERSDAESLDVAGRAYGWLPGRDLLEFQAPIISYDDILSAMAGGGPQRDVPQEQSESDKIHDLHERGMSRRQIALAVWGYTNAKCYATIDAIIAPNATA
jgi:hypothetical protein